MQGLERWADFNVAMTGATAALAGLVIVAASVNIRDIIAAESLTSRLAAGIGSLVLALVGCAVGLVPGIATGVYGATMIVAALAAGALSAVAARHIFGNAAPENRMRPLKAGAGFAAPACYLVGGVLLAIGAEAGLAWFAAGSLLAVVAALLISWVVLVEVLR